MHSVYSCLDHTVLPVSEPCAIGRPWVFSFIVRTQVAGGLGVGEPVEGDKGMWFEPTPAAAER